MGFIVAVAAAVWSAIAAAAAAVVSAITFVITPIISVLTKVVGWLTTAVNAVVNFLHITQVINFLKPLWNIVSIGYSIYNVVRNFQAGKITAGITGVVGAIGTIYTLAGGTLKEFIADIYDSFQQFTQAIHLDLVIQIHDIAYLVSEDYRESMDSVYVQIGKVSRALGNSGEFFTLLLRDAKAVIQDTAAMFGRTYDVGEITWLKTMEDFFKMFTAYTDKYQRNPGALIQDIDQYLIKPAQDNKAILFQNLYGMVESILATSQQVVAEIENVRGLVDETIEDMPANLRKEIEPYMNRVTAKYDEFITTVYNPTQMTVDLAIKRHGDNIFRLAYELKELVDYVKDPAEYIARLAEASEEQRLKAQSIIAQLITGQYKENVVQWAGTVKPQQEWVNRIKQLLQRALTYPEWSVTEVETPQRPADTPVEPRKTWNVGEY